MCVCVCDVAHVPKRTELKLWIANKLNGKTTTLSDEQQKSTKGTKLSKTEYKKYFKKRVRATRKEAETKWHYLCYHFLASQQHILAMCVCARAYAHTKQFRWQVFRALSHLGIIWKWWDTNSTWTIGRFACEMSLVYIIAMRAKQSGKCKKKSRKHRTAINQSSACYFAFIFAMFFAFHQFLFFI